LADKFSTLRFKGAAMTKRALLIAGLVLCAASLVPAAAQKSGSGRLPVVEDRVMLRGSAVRDRFVAAIQKCGVTPTFLPSIIADTPNDGIDYDNGEHAVHISRWSKLDPAVKGAMEGWAKAGTLGLSPEGMWGEIFNELLVAHELGHYLEYMSGKFYELDNWQSEIDADRIALAFWSIDSADAARLPARENNYASFLLALPSPVPKGSDARGYFADHYADLTKDLSAYGWYQGQFMSLAWRDQGKLSFCDWVKANPPHQRQR
jgi:hypothetical protein